jgi:hypothetical protein
MLIRNDAGVGLLDLFDVAAVAELAGVLSVDLDSPLVGVETLGPLGGVTYDESSRLSVLVFVRRRTRLGGPSADGAGTAPTIFFRAWIWRRQGEYITKDMRTHVNGIE